MGWPASLFIGVLNAAIACLASGFVTSLALGWHHVSDREGAWGYATVGCALLGAIAGFAIGVIGARLAPEDSGFARLGMTVCATLALLAAIMALSWLAADFPPTLDGKRLVLETELRVPPGESKPQQQAEDVYCGHVFIRAGGHTVMRRLDYANVRMENDAWVIPGAVPLESRRDDKQVGVCIHGNTHYLDLPVPGRPSRKELEWSDWIAIIAVDATYALRYRLVFVADDAPPAE